MLESRPSGSALMSGSFERDFSLAWGLRHRAWTRSPHTSLAKPRSRSSCSGDAMKAASTACHHRRSTPAGSKTQTLSRLLSATHLWTVLHVTTARRLAVV